MKAENQTPEIKNDSTSIFFYVLVGLLALSMLGFVGYLVLSFFS